MTVTAHPVILGAIEIGAATWNYAYRGYRNAKAVVQALISANSSDSSSSDGNSSSAADDADAAWGEVTGEADKDGDGQLVKPGGKEGAERDFDKVRGRITVPVY